MNRYTALVVMLFLNSNSFCSSDYNFEKSFHLLEKKYQKEAFKKYGYHLKVKADFNSSLSLAGYFIDERSKTFNVTIGVNSLMTLPHMTKEGVLLAACHEIGHLIAKKYGPPFLPKDQMSIEGQADYFAVTECLSHVLDSNKYNIDETLKLFELENEKKWFTRKCINVSTSNCLPTLTAGLSLTYILSDLEQEDRPQNILFDQPTKTDKIILYHPSSNCRFHSIVSASIEGKRGDCWWTQD